jgi:hypothetical protein
MNIYTRSAAGSLQKQRIYNVVAHIYNRSNQALTREYAVLCAGTIVDHVQCMILYGSERSLN